MATDSATLAALRIILGADTADLDKSLKGAEKTVAQFGKGIENVGKELFNLRNAFVVVAGAAVVGFVKHMTDAGDEIAKTAQKIGITTDSLQELRYAASLSGTKTEDFDAALLQLNKRIGDVNGGVTEAMTTLGKLGFSIDEVKGKNTDVVFKMIADRIASVVDPTERARIATELFGKAGQQLLPTIMSGSAGLAQMAAEAHKFGLVLSQETLKKAEEANDEFTRIGSALKVAGINIAVGFLPALEAVKVAVTSPEFQDGVKTLASHFATLITWIVDHKTEIAQAAAAFAGFKLGAAFGSAFGPQAALFTGAAGAIVGYTAATEAAKPEVDKLSQSIAGLTANKEALERLRNKTGNDDQIQSLTLQIDEYDKKIAAATERLLKLKIEAKEAPAAAATVTPGAPPEQYFPQVDKAIEDLSLKTRILRGDFDNLAPGFIETANGLKALGDGLLPAGLAMANISPQLQDLNMQMLAFKGAQMTQSVLPPWQAYENQIRKIQQLYDAGAIGAETYERAMRAAAEKSGVAWDMAGASIAGSFATIAGSFNKTSGGIATAAKAFSIVQATLSVYTGMAKALELPFPANIAAAGAVAAQGFAFVSNIKTQAVPKFQSGGSFRVGGAGALDSRRVTMDVNPGEMVDITPSKYSDAGGAGGTRGGSVQPIAFQMIGEMFSRDHIAGVIEGINRAVADGYRLQVAPR